MPNRTEKYTHYFQVLIDELREHHNFTDAHRPGQGKPYYAFASGTTGIKYVAGFYGKGRQVYTLLGIYFKDREKTKPFLMLSKNENSRLRLGSVCHSNGIAATTSYDPPLVYGVTGTLTPMNVP